MAQRLKGFTAERPYTVLDYTDKDYELSLGLRAAMRDPHAVDNLVIRLPQDNVIAKLNMERSIVFQLMVARQQGDDSREFWENLLKAYTSRSEEVILGQVGLDTLAGMTQVKERLRKRVIFPYLAGMPSAPSFVLADGPPGGGKTVTASKLAQELGYAFIQVSYADLAGGDGNGPSYGQTAQKLAEVFEEAKSKAPAVLFLDELSSIARVRQNSYTGNDLSVTTDALLQELDKIKQHNDNVANQNRRVLVVGAANHVEDLDSAIRSRAIKVHFPKPDQEQIRLIARQRLEEACQAFDIQNTTPELLDEVARHIAQATPDSARLVEAMVQAVANAAHLENSGILTLELARQEIHAELHGVDASAAVTSSDSWKSVSKKLKAGQLPSLVPGVSAQAADSSWMSPDEWRAVDALLPEGTLLKKSIASQGMLSRLYDKATQNKLEFGSTALMLLTPLVVSTLGILAAKGALMGGVVLAASVTLQGLQQALSRIGAGQESTGEKLNQSIDMLKATLAQKSAPEGGAAGSKGPVRFGASQGQGQGQSVNSVQSGSAQSAPQVQKAVQEIRELSHLLGSKMSQPKTMLTIAEQLMDRLLNMADEDGGVAGDKLKRDVSLTRNWLKNYYGFKSQVPQGAKLFSELPEQARQDYRALLFKSIRSGIPNLEEWGVSEARRVGYSPAQIQEIKSLTL